MSSEAKEEMAKKSAEVHERLGWALCAKCKVYRPKAKLKDGACVDRNCVPGYDANGSEA